MSVEIYVVISIVTGVVAIAGFVAAVVIRAWAFGKKWMNFFSDWFGEEARPGVSKRPGVMERLDCQDQQLVNINTRLSTVESELKPNSGTTVKDTVHRTDKAMLRVEQQLERIGEHIGNE